MPHLSNLKYMNLNKYIHRNSEKKETTQNLEWMPAPGVTSGIR